MKTPRFSWRVDVSAVCPRCTDYSYFTVTSKFKIYEEEFKKLILARFQKFEFDCYFSIVNVFCIGR